MLGFKPGRGPLLPVVMRLGDTLSPQGGGWAVLARAVGEELSRSGVPGPAGRAAGRGAGAAAARAARGGGPAVRRGPGGGRAARRGGARGHAAAGRTAARGGGRAGRRLGGGADGAAARGGGGDGGAGSARRPWYDARRLDIDLLLWRLRDHPDLADFVQRAIGPLLDHDRRSRPALLPDPGDVPRAMPDARRRRPASCT
ncbi:hypothetical protein GCM10019016_041460 [Streptomyces prasinosporus]|uniref:Uncharacterized protein n=1 Tax=Streptomyces prasinosporus TaxID=68256 RepID=A0ABP6TQK8_9ACTN